uniref:Uncharacterized protein n=1 Tax=Ananas comosus var. bracteatus TaxID=296719 RepID=A0A6V7PZ44_ANACO|nr:unnamed protein product [Ananas comosus var. bracteatus]
MLEKNKSLLLVTEARLRNYKVRRLSILGSLVIGAGRESSHSSGQKVGPGQCNAEFPVHYFYAWRNQYFPKLYMKLPLPDLGKLKDYVPEMLAIENIEAGKFDAKMARFFIRHPMSFTWRCYKKGLCYNEHQREELANQDRQLKKERTN